jgi:hypothetical protein
VVRKSVGFNWGPAAVSTSYWTGVRLCDLLAHCGVQKPGVGARYVCFRGVRKELPQARTCITAGRDRVRGVCALNVCFCGVRKEPMQARTC